MRKGLQYIVAYLMWIVVLALGLWFIVISREVLLSLLARHAGESTQRARQVGLLDKLFVLGLGVIWLILLVGIEDFFKKGVQRDILAQRIAKVLGPEFFSIFVADASLLWLTSSQHWVHWLMVVCEFVIGVLLIMFVRFTKPKEKTIQIA